MTKDELDELLNICTEEGAPFQLKLQAKLLEQQHQTNALLKLLVAVLTEKD